MRMAGMNRSQGSVTVLMVAALPLMVAALIVIVEIGRISVARARLQSATDRAAYAGAASQADSMNRLAKSNWQIYKAFRDLESDFASDSQQDEQAAKQRIEKYEAERDRAIDEMGGVLGDMQDASESAARSTFASNYPSASAGVSISGDIEIDDSQDPEQQWGELGYSHITGDLYLDPEDVDGGSYEALKYMIKEGAGGAAIGVFASAWVEPLTANTFMGDGIEVFASSAAGAFGGSLEDFAQKESEDLDSAEGWETEEGTDALYRASLIPLWAAGVEGFDN